MKRALAATIAMIGLFALAESLTCNQCPVGLVGICLLPSTVNCNGTTSSCYTGQATFPSITGFLGLNYQGCVPSSGCNSISNGTILGATYVIKQSCCNTDKCNPVQTNSAPYTQLSLTVALSAALMTISWGTYIN